MPADLYLFPISEYWTFYLGFTIFVSLLLALDLGVFHRHAHEVRFREAAAWSVAWISLALVFNYLLYGYAKWKFAQDPALNSLAGFHSNQIAAQVALEFLTGYIIEYSLSVDNIFVFLVVFNYFGIAQKYQHRVLFYGIIGAIFFRISFIAVGAVIMQISWVEMVFGAFLLFTGIKMFFTSEKEIDPGRNPVIKLLRRFLPVTSDIQGQKFFVRVGKRLHATPLLIALIFLELTDIVFAVDSVPAIYAITKEPFIVYTSNIFAILGLRSLYFMLTTVIQRFHLLKYGLACVLAFVGLKMIWLDHFFGGKFPINMSLGIIAGCLGLSVILSFAIKPSKDK